MRTLSIHDLIARGMSRATAYRRLKAGETAGSLTFTTEVCVGGNGAKQPRRVVVLPDDA